MSTNFVLNLLSSLIFAFVSIATTYRNVCEHPKCDRGRECIYVYTFAFKVLIKLAFEITFDEILKKNCNSQKIPEASWVARYK